MQDVHAGREVCKTGFGTLTRDQVPLMLSSVANTTQGLVCVDGGML
jgi:hypothetical protein